MKKRNWCILVLCALLAILPVAALADIPATPMEAFYVNDYADVISAADEREMLALGEALEDETGAQVVVVTVQFLDGMDIEEYCYQLFNKWGIGQTDKNNGVLLLISIGDRLIQTTVGRGLEEKLPASITDKYTDTYAMPYLAEDDFSTGLRENYRALCDKMASLSGVSLGGQSAGYSSDNYSSDRVVTTTMEGGIDFMEIIIGVIVLVVILSVVRSVFSSAGSASGCLFGWLLGRGSRGTRWHRPPMPPFMGRGHHHHGPRPPRPRPPFGRSTGSFGGNPFGGGRSSGGSRPSGGGSRPSGGRTGGGGSTRGGGSGRKF